MTATAEQSIRDEDATRFVGRVRELAVLDAAFQDTAEGGSRLVLVSGEPGIGKTELVRAFAGRARGAVVLWGGAWEEGGAPPYWPWAQILRSHRRQQGGDGEVLAQLLPGNGPVAAGERARFALFSACCDILADAARTAPLVVVLDDLHAAGRPSALLLRFAATERLARVLLVATYRTAEARLREDVADVITALESTGTQLVLNGLSQDEIAALLPGVDDRVLDVVGRRSDGNPLFVTQVARLLGQHGVEDLPVPAGIRQAVAGQLARLRPTDTTRRVLATAAAMGEAEPRVVAEATGTDGDEVARLLDAATGVGLLAARPGGGYRFGHALIREALYEQLAPRARAEVHARIADVLDARRASHARVAHHLVRAVAVSGEIAARAVRYARLAGDDALDALAYEEAVAHFQQALDALARAPESTAEQRCELLLRLASARSRTGWTPEAVDAVDTALRLARRAGQPHLLATAALLAAQYLDFNAPPEDTIALLREAADVLDPGVLRTRVLARLAIAMNARPDQARTVADDAVRTARQVGATEDRAPAAALAGALIARHHTRWGTEEPHTALADADEIVAAAHRADEPDVELDGRVLRLTHLLEAGDGPAAHRELPELLRLAAVLRHPAARLVAASRQATIATLTGDFPRAHRFARQAWLIGHEANLPDAGAVYWGQLYGIWLHTDLAESDYRWMHDELSDLVARSHLSVAHAAALVQLEAAAGAGAQAAGRLADLLTRGLPDLRPDMVYVWTLTLLAEGCRTLGMTGHARRLYGALVPYAGRYAVAAGAVLCAGSTDLHLAGLAELCGEPDTAERHYQAAARANRRLGAHPMLAHTLHRHALLLRTLGRAGDAERAAAEARDIAVRHGMTKLLAVQPGPTSPHGFALRRDDDLWLVTFDADGTRLPDSVGLRYLDQLVRNPDRELPASDLVAITAGTRARPAPERGDEVIDARARAAYRQRLADLDADLAEAEEWHDTERAARLRGEKDFLVHELAAATGLGGRTRRLGSDAERARVNVTRAIRSAIDRIRERLPAGAEYLDHTVHTGTCCVYRPAPDRG